MGTRAAVMSKWSRLDRPRPGFTLIEVLVVVAIIALLVSILLPSLSRAREMARRAVCATRLHNIGLAVHEYSHSNKGKIIECMASSLSSSNPSRDSDGYGASTQICIAPRKAAPGTAGAHPEDYVDWQAMAKKHRLDRELWECPNRPGAFQYEGDPGPDQGYDAAWLRKQGYAVNTEVSYQQWVLGYQYFGGMPEWRNFTGVFKSRSPRDSNAKPQWALAADSNVKVDGQWGGGALIRASAYANVPPHPAADGRPDGGNVLTFDGAVSWIRFGRMRFIHGWHNTGREGYWYQADLGDMVRRR